MEIVLSPVEARVLGCLIEKEVTTPDYYPLSLNSLINACNQKSNRDPVMNLDEPTVANTLFELRQKKLANQVNTIGYRISKFEHTVDQAFDFSDAELAVMCVLMLRGPQTPGEIRGRTGRLYEFTSPAEVEDTFRALAEREDGPFVVCLPRLPGKRESRYAHLLCGEVEIDEESLVPFAPVVGAAGASEAKLDELEEKFAILRSEFDELKQKFDSFVTQFE